MKPRLRPGPQSAKPDDAIADVRSACADLRLEIPVARQERLVRFLAMLQHWNTVYNLTAVRDAKQMRVLHLFDCLAIVEPLRRQLGPLAGKRLLDVGSGAGLPGVVLGIVEPDLQVVCVDAVSKKAAFVRQVAAELALSNVQSRQARVEMLDEAPFGIIVSRAFAALPLFVRSTRRLLAKQGVWMAMKGRPPVAEIAGLPSDVQAFHVELLSVPRLEAERSLIWLRPLQAADAPETR